MTTAARFLVILAMLCAGAPGCKSRPQNAEPGAPAGPAAPGPKDPQNAPAEPAPAPSRRPPLDPAEARAFVDGWLAVQNKGDFAGYEALYASRFTGVRRSGARTVQLNRAGWVADRKRMFKKAMKVEVSDLVVEPFAGGAAVRFTQRWASGKYEDVGPKQMVLVREGGVLRIAREEMLASRILGRAARETDLADAGFAFVIDADGPYVVLGEATQVADPVKLELVSDGDPVVVKGKVAVAGLPPEIASWSGVRVRNGECVAKIVDFAVISRSYPHFITMQEWRGGLEEDAEPYSEEEIARSAYSSGSAVIAGRLDHDCGGLFVYRDGRPAPVEAEVVSDPELTRAAIKAFRALSEYEEIQESFVDSKEGSGLWDEHDGGGGPRVWAYRHPRTGAVVVAVHARSGRGCGDFSGNLGALFQVKGTPGKGKPALEHLGTIDVHEVEGAWDVDGDGTLQVVARDEFGGVMLLSRTGERLQAIEIPYYDCPC